ncbi:hypothetical protein DU002_11170 [Corallincola holothuriorum]|uniref:Uncharacterized protein n=2 Tax=Corallincola holothuriorum TaxID=2282215 RepID=A0A368NIB5_9GAMM|nr:hypothetical protein DU002_11170 [Corallincola holothuriorum]
MLCFCAVAKAAPMVDLSIDGNTWNQPFVLENLSTEGELITSVSIDLSALDLVFDVQGWPAKIEFLDDGIGSYKAYQKSSGEVLDGSNDVLELSFDDYVSESFSWIVDVDFVDPALEFVSVYGNDLLNGIVTVSFDSGETLIDTFKLVDGNDDAVSLSVPAPAPLALLAVTLIAGGVLRRKS